jgi:hypothetical protein
MPSPNSSIIFLLNAGMSSGFRLVTIPSPVTTFSSTQIAPALFKSVCIDENDVNRRFWTTPASINEAVSADQLITSRELAESEY